MRISRRCSQELGMTEVPLMCCQEMYVEGSLNRCIRVLVYIYQEAEKTQAYISGRGCKLKAGSCKT